MTTATLDLQARFRDYRHYHEHLKIEDRASHVLIPFKLNRIQQRIYNRIAIAGIEGRPCRLIILKARREGVSTLVQSVFAHRAFTRRNVHCFTVSHEDDSTRALHRMTERMWTHLPPALKPKQDTREQGKRLWLTHGSSFEVSTAGGNGDVGRSDSATQLHLSEVAHYGNAAATLMSVMQIVPDSPGTLIVMESTANGRAGKGSEFYQEWNAANDPSSDSDFEPLFFSWFDFPDYQRPAEPGFERSLSKDERELRDRFELSLSQLAWRRWKIGNDLQRNEDKFRQEYPSTPEEAFLYSGRPYFHPKQLARLRPRKPVFRGELQGAYRKGEVLRPYEDERGPLRIYRKPVAGHRYILTVDPAGTVTAKDEAYFVQPSEARDFTAMTVIDRHTLEQCAVWHSRFDLGMVGVEAAKVARLYNRAMIAIETNGGYGGPVISKLQEIGYTNLYTREVIDDTQGKFKSVKRTEIGWLTTPTTRPRILEGLRDVLRDHPELLADADLVAEMGRFIIDDAGKETAEPGAHDDLVLCTAVGYEVVREKPQRVLVQEAA